MKNNHKIFEIDKSYKWFFMTIIRSVMRAFIGLPLQDDDLYNLFLFEMQQLLDIFQENKGVSFSTFAGIRCRFFTFKICRQYSSSKYLSQNLAPSLPLFIENSSYLSECPDDVDQEILTNEMIIKALNEKELEYFDLRYVQDLTYKDILKEMKCSIATIKGIERKLKEKIGLLIVE